MTKKLTLICITLLVLSLSGCAYDLEEREGVYNTVKSYANLSGGCEHHFMYYPTLAYADSSIYPVAQYHYVRCVNYGVDPLCDFYPRCEEHQSVEDASGSNQTMLAYNGRRYRLVPQKCTICDQRAGQKYILAEPEE